MYYYIKKCDLHCISAQMRMQRKYRASQSRPVGRSPGSWCNRTFHFQVLGASGYHYQPDSSRGPGFFDRLGKFLHKLIYPGRYNFCKNRYRFPGRNFKNFYFFPGHPTRGYPSGNASRDVCPGMAIAVRISAVYSAYSMPGQCRDPMNRISFVSCAQWIARKTDPRMRV